MRCKTCDRIYFNNDHPPLYPGEDYCPACEVVIAETIREMEGEEENESEIE